MTLLSPTVAVRVLGVTSQHRTGANGRCSVCGQMSPDPRSGELWIVCAPPVSAVTSDDRDAPADLGQLIEYAARARAVERWPLALEDRDGDAAPEYEPNDGGNDGAPPAAVRHVCAGALVASLVTGFGFPYAPWLPLGAGSIRPGWPENDDTCEEPIPEEATQATRGRYGVAEAACQALLGMSTTRGPDQTPEALHEAAIDLAIDAICDERHHVAEIVAEAAALLLLRHRGAWVAPRARRMLGLVGARAPKEDA